MLAVCRASLLAKFWQAPLVVCDRLVAACRVTAYGLNDPGE